LPFVVVLLAVVIAGACTRDQPVPTRDPAQGTIVLVAGPPLERISAGEARRGVGWYPDVEVDAEDRVHVAWTDADVGDVMYAVSPAGASTPGEPEPVETQGAAGAFVRLALTPGNQPVISYYHQGDHTLRVAHRPADVGAMKAAGADVDVTPPPAAAAHPLAKGWVGEDIAFGDDAGAGSSLVVDKHGRPHLLYGVKGDRVRYARRPENVPAFGAAGVGTWEKVDVDTRSGQSPTLINSLLVLDDGTAVASYCDFQVVMGHLRLAVRPPGVPLFAVTSAREEPKAGFDGTSNALLPRKDGKLDVASVVLGENALLVGTFDPKAPSALVERRRVGPARGATVVKRGDDGTLWALERDPLEKGDHVPGLYLLEIPAGDPAQARAVLLEKTTADDPWIDLALRKDGRPVAVWFSEEAKGLKLYAP
jgi:hypothetical protein